MRTTLTLTPEADSLVRAAMAEHGWTFKEAVNQAIVRGIGGGAGTPFSTPTYPIGLRPITGDRALALAGDLEEAELIRKRDLGK
ncbi:MAG: hypothetical protein LBG60_04595 [Bifidobacteriaceae bacterium]|nr:hypothetical protein [Bifidobacteriaceae bacterium]